MAPDRAEPAVGPVCNQINLVVSDMAASLAFYRLLGVEVEGEAEYGAFHTSLEFGSFSIDLDHVDFVPSWDGAASGATGGSTVIGFSLDSRQAVDETYARLTEAGHHGHQEPYDAFWGSRYAIVDDPDGNPVGLMSPRSDEHRVWPPPRLKPASTA